MNTEPIDPAPRDPERLGQEPPAGAVSPEPASSGAASPETASPEAATTPLTPPPPEPSARWVPGGPAETEPTAPRAAAPGTAAPDPTAPDTEGPDPSLQGPAAQAPLSQEPTAPEPTAPRPTAPDPTAPTEESRTVPGAGLRAERRTGPRTGPIVWGALILAFCAYATQLVFGSGPLDTTAWLIVTVLGLGVLLLGVGLAVIIRNRGARK